MPWAQVVPVVDLKVRGLCAKPYPRHPRGCPNYGKPGRIQCPPLAPELGHLFDLTAPAFAVWNVFDLWGHVQRMSRAHPEWSLGQVYNARYWQAGARKVLQAELEAFWKAHPELAHGRFAGWSEVIRNKGHASLWDATTCPEAMGLDVTATLAGIGIVLEWPPVTTALQVAFVGRLK